MTAVTYGSRHWRDLISHMGGEPARVMMRQVRVDGAPDHAEILDGGKWRALQSGETFVSRRAPLVQVDNDWVR